MSLGDCQGVGWRFHWVMLKSSNRRLWSEQTGLSHTILYAPTRITFENVNHMTFLSLRPFSGFPGEQNLKLLSRSTQQSASFPLYWPSLTAVPFKMCQPHRLSFLFLKLTKYIPTSGLCTCYSLCVEIPSNLQVSSFVLFKSQCNCQIFREVLPPTLFTLVTLHHVICFITFIARITIWN